MAHQVLVAALSVMVATLPTPDHTGTTGAPEGGPTTRYCLRVDPVIGSRIETVQCMTRGEWADLDVDVDQEWAQNGVRVIA